MSSWKYNRVWCTKTNKFYTKNDLEKLTFKEFNDIREFFVCEYHNDAGINCQARMIARTKSLGRPKKPEEHFEIHCFATHKVDNHSVNCPYDYIKTIGSSYIVEDKISTKENIKLLAILNKNVQENTNTEKALQKAQQTIHKPEINQNKVRNIGNTGVIGKRWRTYIASKVLNVDEMNYKGKCYIFKENNVLIKGEKIISQDSSKSIIKFHVYKNYHEIYWLAFGYLQFNDAISDKKIKALLDNKYHHVNISFLAWKGKLYDKVSFWLPDYNKFAFYEYK